MAGKVLTFGFLAVVFVVLVWAVIGTQAEKVRDGGYYNAAGNWQRNR